MCNVFNWTKRRSKQKFGAFKKWFTKNVCAILLDHRGNELYALFLFPFESLMVCNELTGRKWFGELVARAELKC